MINPEEEEHPPQDALQDQTADNFVGFYWNPNKLCDEYMEKFEGVKKVEVN